MDDQNKLDFKGRVAIITGAGSGMGREHALMLASRGAKVVVNDISIEGAERTVKEIIEAAGTAVVDNNDIITKAPDLVKTAVDSFGRLDIVVNNAGNMGFGRFWETESSQWWHVFDTHVKGTVEVTRHAMPYLIESGSGRLINISSSAMLGTPNASAYGAAKAAIWGLGNSLAMEAKEFGVQVTTLHPSAWTPMTEHAFDNPAVHKVLREKLPAVAVSAFVTWLAHQDTTVYGECFQVSGASAGRTSFGVMPRTRVSSLTPEEWVKSTESIMQNYELTPLRNVSESLRAELIFLDPSMENEIPLDAADVSSISPERIAGYEKK